MSDFPMQTQITLVICLTVVALCLIVSEYSERMERENEITNRVLGTNGVKFKRRE